MTPPVAFVLRSDEVIPEIARDVVVAFVVRRVGMVEVDVVVAVKNADTTSPTTESLAYGDVVPIPRLPVKYEFADVVAIKLPTVS